MPSDPNDQKYSNGKQASPQRPAALLDGDAALAWQAYNAMETTKMRHYSLLEIIDNKKKNYNIDATEADKQMLQYLLDDHSAQVKQFTDASKQLKSVNAEGHQQLFDYIGLVGNLQASAEQSH